MTVPGNCGDAGQSMGRRIGCPPMREDSEPGAFALSVATISENFFTNDDHDGASRLVNI